MIKGVLVGVHNITHKTRATAHMTRYVRYTSLPQSFLHSVKLSNEDRDSKEYWIFGYLRPNSRQIHVITQSRMILGSPTHT
jgi:hypothetical protein